MGYWKPVINLSLDADGVLGGFKSGCCHLLLLLLLLWEVVFRNPLPVGTSGPGSHHSIEGWPSWPWSHKPPVSFPGQTFLQFLPLNSSKMDNLLPILMLPHWQMDEISWLIEKKNPHSAWCCLLLPLLKCRTLTELLWEWHQPSPDLLFHGEGRKLVSQGLRPLHQVTSGCRFLRCPFLNLILKIISN